MLLAAACDMQATHLSTYAFPVPCLSVRSCVCCCCYSSCCGLLPPQTSRTSGLNPNEAIKTSPIVTVDFKIKTAFFNAFIVRFCYGVFGRSACASGDNNKQRVWSRVHIAEAFNVVRSGKTWL